MHVGSCLHALSSLDRQCNLMLAVWLRQSMPACVADDDASETTTDATAAAAAASCLSRPFMHFVTANGRFKSQ